MMLFDEEKKPIQIEIPRMRRGAGTFVMVRFRNKADLDKFSDLIDEPRLRGMAKNTAMKIKWSADVNERNAMDQFFNWGEDE